MKEYGFFGEKAGSYVITKLPPAGNYEYIYTNENMLVRLDQFGISFVQINPPTGDNVFMRESREEFSPVKTYFCKGRKVYNNFDVFSADKIKITFSPEKAEYLLTFGKLDVKTEIFLTEKDKRFVMVLSFKNNGDKNIKLQILESAYPCLKSTTMAAWDKLEWYTETRFLIGQSAFLTTEYSVEGKKENRRYLTFVTDCKIDGYEISSEKLLTETKGFSNIARGDTNPSNDTLYGFSQCHAVFAKCNIKGGEEYTTTQVFAVTEKEEDIDREIELSKEYFNERKRQTEIENVNKKYSELFAVNRVHTKDKTFDNFVNAFLPLELSWVTSLDRGWATGMRGVRDASNDFQGYLTYDSKKCREVIANIFSKQRSDGWYPRQIPFVKGAGFDLREFVDSACFFTEFVYDYLAYTDDYTILDEIFPYYDSDKKESGLNHLINGIDYFIKEENIGEHRLVKVRGGDWLDCLGGIGKKGRGETVMVSCQLVVCLGYVTEIIEKVTGKTEKKYTEFAKNLKDAINKYAYNDRNFYNAFFTDNGDWLFSACDTDGKERLYIPANAYAVISGVAEGKEKEILSAIKKLRTSDGYRLFTFPLGISEIEGVGKMGTGDFRPNLLENASVYNHGSQCFLLRAAAKVGDIEYFNDVLNFALPIYHDEERICAAPYAITNCYQLVPYYYGRVAFSFLTGCVAMSERIIYSWLFGVGYTLGNVVITPCVPKRFENAEVSTKFMDTRIKIKYNGYGTKIKNATLNGKALDIDKNGRSVSISKEELKALKEVLIEIEL